MTDEVRTGRSGVILRRILSVIAGLAVVFVLSTVTDEALHRTGVMPRGALFDTRLLVLALFYRSIFSVLGCYVAARLAPDRPMRHALVLGGIGVVLSAAGTIAARDLGPAWYGLALAVLAMPLAWIGGRLARAGGRAAREERNAG